MKKIIILPHGARTELAKEFKVSRITVRDALDYKTDSQLARTLRAAALARGGAEFRPGSIKIAH